MITINRLVLGKVLAGSIYFELISDNVKLWFSVLFCSRPKIDNNFPSITESTNLEGKIAEEIFLLENLVELNLRTNKLSGTLPSQIGDVQNLTSIRLGFKT